MERIVIDMEHINPSAAQVAATLKDAISAANLSQRDVAERSGIPLTTLNRHLNGHGLTWDEIRSISTVVGRSASSMIADTAIRVAADRGAAA